jgi:predicted N-acetyltransferase YhbS
MLPAMTDSLDLHRASPDEIAAAHTNVFDLWSKGLPLAEHVASRLASPSHSRADWYVGCIDGKVVVSLGCYPIQLLLHGRELPGIAIGSVYTVAAFRGRGFAPRLLEFVENTSVAAGARLSILYCDIEPNYYARLGYQLCPAVEAYRELRADPPDLRQAPTLTEVDGPASQADLARLYANYHGRFGLLFARSPEYWQAIFKKFGTDRFFAWRDAHGDWLGYVRVGFTSTPSGESWRITDFALADHQEETASSLYAGFLALAREHGAVRAGGWLPDSPAARRWFDLAPRRKEITMIKPLAGQSPLDAKTLAETCYFCEIDHV